MCGRGTQEYSWREVHEALEIVRPGPAEAPNLEPKYNVAPTTMIDVVRQGPDGRELVRMRWELVPFWWRKTLKEKRFSTFNAKAETLKEAASYRGPWKKGQRCVVPFNFFEWKRPKKKGQPPLYIFPKHAPFFLMAGLWDEWTDKDTGEVVMGCTIITVPPNDFMSDIHDRMPVILAQDDLDVWFTGDVDRAEALLKPCPSEWMDARPVSAYVNSVYNQGPECIQPVGG